MTAFRDAIDALGPTAMRTTAEIVLAESGGGGGGQPLDATLTGLAAMTVGAADLAPVSTGADAFTTMAVTAAARTVLDDTTTAAMLTTLGAAPIASPTFTGTPAAPTAAAATNTTQLATTAFVTAAVAAGGGGGGQPSDATLTGLAAMTVGAADLVPVSTGPDAFTTMTVTSAARSVLDDTTTAAMLATLGAAATSHTHTYASLTSLPASIDAIDALTPAADRLAYYTGASAAALATITGFARTILDDADAATVLATIGALPSASYTAADVLTKLLTVDTDSSGLNADTLDGVQGSGYATSGHTHAYSSLTSIPASIDAIDGLTPAADRIAYYTSASAAALATVTSFARTILDDNDAATVLATIGALPSASYTAADVLTKLLTVDTDSSGLNADTLDGVQGSGYATAAHTHTYASLTSLPAALDALDALTPAADQVPYFTSGSAAALTTVTSVARTVLDDTTTAAMLTTLGAEPAANITAAARTVLDDSTVGAMLTTMGGAPLASPALTGTPTAPTAAVGTNTTQVATTAYAVAGFEPLGETTAINTQTASYTLVLADKGKIVEMDVASGNNLTVPLNSSVAFPIKTRIDLVQYGAGQTTVVATGGVTIRAAVGLKLAVQYAGATLYKRGTDEWVLIGNLSA